MLLPSLVLWSMLAPAESTPAPAAQAAVEDALSTASPTPASARTLTEALALAEARAPELAHDPAALALLDNARLALASINLAIGEATAAAATMDEAIRSAIGRELTAANFGPAVLELYDRRLALLRDAGRATLEIDCQGCQVIVNETATGSELELYLGRYRVWVEFDEPGRGPEQFEVELNEPGEVAGRSFILAPPPAHEPTDHTASPTSRFVRTTPRWASLAALSAGAMLFVSGVVLSTIHGKCRGDPFGGDLNDLEACSQIYENRPQDLALIGIGSSVMVASGVVLTIDEVRVGRARGRQAMLTWTLRF